ncbi:Methionine--tRNA ligase [Babesia caballi]|uniref:methionine--tRNA ligase n=1 Tax=Babesia caballi TaxID=5871 RepID=A0AAV4LZV3_BABCB|nr:Methionine--tRNA ligase [Babesia caballi]
MRAHYREVQLAYNVPVDVNVHTAEESHKRKVVEAFTKLLSSGDIYEGLHQGYFSPAEDAYYTKCQLQNGRSPQGFAVQPVAEKAFFFRLSKYRDALRQIMGKEGFLLPDKRRNEALALLSSDLPDIAVTRSNTEWGVPVNVPGFEGHTVYVWLDALLGYATNYPQKGLYTNTIMVFGKDILRFIALVWPALLIAFGLPLPQQLICHGWLMHNDAKISKSKGEKVLALPPVGAPDVARFVLMNLGAFGEDIQFDRDRVENLVEVVRDKYANLTHRLTGLLNKRNVEQLGPGGQVPPDLFVEQVVGRWRTLELTMRQYRIDKYGDEVSRVAADINSYITQNRLWEIQDEKELKRHGLVLCQSLLALTIYVYPIMPTLAQLNLERLQPDIDGVPVGIGTASDILQNLGRVAFKPQHMGALM